MKEEEKSAFYFDIFLWYLLCYKALVLFVFTMPPSWFWGVKIPILRWAARSTYIQLYLSVFAPVMAVCIVIGFWSAMTYPERWGTDPLEAQRRFFLSSFNLLFLFVTKRLYLLIHGNPDSALALEHNAEIRSLINFELPPVTFLRLLLAPLKLMFPVTILGAENIPKEKKRILFVGNHCIWALDSPFLILALYDATGIWMRSLAEHSWFVLPGVAELVHLLGGVDGTRENCRLLMTLDSNILVYPGGVREAWKLPGDPKYCIQWEHHLGFCRMAIEHGYTIVPVASIGMEDFFRPLLGIPVAWLMRGMGAIKGMGGQRLDAPALVPRSPLHFQRLYMHIGKPIDTQRFHGASDNQQYLIELRDEVAAALKGDLEFLLKHRSKDPKRYTLFPSIPRPNDDDPIVIKPPSNGKDMKSSLTPLSTPSPAMMEDSDEKQKRKKIE